MGLIVTGSLLMAEKSGCVTLKPVDPAFCNALTADAVITLGVVIGASEEVIRNEGQDDDEATDQRT